MNTVPKDAPKHTIPASPRADIEALLVAYAANLARARVVVENFEVDVARAMARFVTVLAVMVLGAMTTGCVDVLGDFAEGPVADGGDGDASGAEDAASERQLVDAQGDGQDGAQLVDAAPDTGTIVVDDGQADAGGGSSGVCTSGATQCVTDVYVQTCGPTGQWGPGTACAHACVSGACGGATACRRSIC